jgi:hypothetical protein
MNLKKLRNLKVGMQVRTSPVAKRFGLGDHEEAIPSLVWKITKVDDEQIVLFNERLTVGPLSLPRDHVRIHAFNDDPEGSDGLLALNCQIRIKLGQVDCPLIRG